MPLVSDLEHANPFQRSRRVIQIRAIAIWGIVIFLAAGSFFYFTRSRESSLLIVGLTTDASITLNGKVPNLVSDPRGIKIPLYAGKYRLAITRSDRLPFSQDVTVASGKTLEIRPVFGLYPSANGEVAGDIDFVRPSPDGKAIYYLGDSRSRLFRMEIANQVSVPITTTPLGTVLDVEWSSDPEVALIVERDGTYLREIPSYDFTTQRTVKIAEPEVQSPVWDPNNTDRIASALFKDNGEHSLILSDRHFTRIDRKADLTGFTNPLLVWSPDSRFIAVINRSSDDTRNDMWVYTLADGSFKQVTTGGSVVSARFSPDGTSAVYEKLTAGKHMLSAISTADGTAYPLTMEGLVSQAAWKNGNSFYLPDGATMRLIGVSGSIAQIPYTGPDINDIKSMFYFADQKVLVFATAGQIYTVDLSS